MINSGRTIAVLTALTVLGATLLGFAVWRLNTPGSSSIWSVYVGVGIVPLLLVAIFLLLAVKARRRTARLMRPEMQVARWQVSAATWEAFVAYEARLRDIKDHLPNLLKAGRKAVKHPLEVIAAKGGMLIGGRLFEVEPRGMMALREVRWHGGPPECLELVLIETALINTGSSLRIQTRWVAVRVPVEPTARDSAIAAHQFYTAVEAAGEISKPGPARILVRIALALAAICFLVAASGFLMHVQELMAGSPVPRILAFLGTMVGLAALVTAGIIWAAMLRKG